MAKVTRFEIQPGETCFGGRGVLIPMIHTHKPDKAVKPNPELAAKFLLAAELEDPNCPDECLKELGTNDPGFDKECWDFIRQYELIQPGYVNTEAQTLAFCLAAAIVENP